MQIFVKSLAGKTFTLYVEPSCTIGDLKAQIFAKEGLLPGEFDLVHLGQPVVGVGGVAAVAEAGIVAEAKLSLAMCPGVDIVESTRFADRLGMISGRSDTCGWLAKYQVWWLDGIDDEGADVKGDNWRSDFQLSLAPRFAARLAPSYLVRGGTSPHEPHDPHEPVVDLAIRDPPKKKLRTSSSAPEAPVAHVAPVASRDQQHQQILQERAVEHGSRR